MGKAAAKDKTTTPAQSELERSLAAFTARQDFLNAALNMGWQLAITIIVPVFIGVKLDDRFNTSPSYTLAALFLAVALSIVVVARIIKQVNDASKGSKS